MAKEESPDKNHSHDNKKANQTSGDDNVNGNENKNVTEDVTADMKDKGDVLADEQFVKEHSFSAVKIVLITIAVLLVIGMIVVGFGGYYVYSQLQPVDPQSDELVVVDVPMGSSAAHVGTVLEENGLIHNEQIFYYYLRFTGDTDFQAGEYELSPSMEIDELVERLQEGQTFAEAETFTIPEGYTVEQIAAHLDDEEHVDEETFLQVVNEGDFSDFWFVEEIPDVEERDYRLEGFLFPETYEISAEADEEDYIRRMLSQFEREFDEEWYTALEGSGLDLYETVTLASIVEREAVLDEERSIIAGVFHNRLDEGMRLESCATIMYFLEEDNIMRLTYDDLEEEHPYNTYLNDDLPPGPIANPGRTSLEASVYPDAHDYQYFVIKDDGSNGHHFAETYEEHLANDAQSRGNLPAGAGE